MQRGKRPHLQPSRLLVLADTDDKSVDTPFAVAAVMMGHEFLVMAALVGRSGRAQAGVSLQICAQVLYKVALAAASAYSRQKNIAGLDDAARFPTRCWDGNAPEINGTVFAVS